MAYNWLRLTYFFIRTPVESVHFKVSLRSKEKLARVNLQIGYSFDAE